jgi:eukaryotic-like serine/threonine-protein kinase
VPDTPFDAEAWARLQPLVDRALDLDEPARSAFVDELARTDPEEGRRLAQFLRQADAALEPVERALSRQPALVMAALSEADEGLLLPSRIGPYLVRGTIGRGGMGTVLLAERADGEFEQQVALKLVKRGMDSAEILERFRTERQIVARLQHPHIARLLDGGATPDGQPWFAMEHVAGQALAAYCDERRLPTEARVRLFLQVCDAVDYAHRNLVVHRDLKPSNVLVTADGQAKLLDFGIAKVLDPDGDDVTVTRRESRALTPAYAAPEQIRGEPVTTATDVYSLGVTLYELLSGHRPFAQPGASRTAVEKAVLEQEPDPPSRAAGRGDADARDQVAAARGTSADRLARILRDDLDTIVLTAIRKAPERRYASARALADDLRRSQEGLPVLARPDTLAYRTSRFVRRHRVGVAAAALVAVSIVGGVAATVRQTREALKQARKAEAVKGFVLSVFAQSDPNASKGKDVTARQLLAQGAARARSELASQPETRADMLLFLGNLHRQIGLEVESVPLLEEALALRRTVAPDDSAAVAEAEVALGSATLVTGDLKRARQLFEGGLAKRRRHLGESHADTAFARGLLGRVLLEQGDLPGAHALLARAVADERRVPAPQAELASNLNALGRVLQAESDYRGAEPLYTEALAMRRRLLGEEDTRVSETLVNLGTLQKDLGDPRRAAATFREALALDRRVSAPQPKIASDLNNLGGALLVTADYAEAETLYRESLEIRARLYGADHPRSAIGLHTLARALRCLGRTQEAESLSRRALLLATQLLGDDHTNVAAVRDELAETLLARGRTEEAEELARRAATTYRQKLPADHPLQADAALTLARVLLATGRASEAEPLLRAAVALRERRFGASDWRPAEARVLLADCLGSLGRSGEAAVERRAAEAALGAALGARHPLTVRAAENARAPVSEDRRSPEAPR